MEEEVVNNNTDTVTEKKNNKCAIASLVCSLAGLLVAGMPLGIVAVITGIIGLVQVNKKGTEKGKGMAIAGIIVGALDVILVAASVVVIIASMLAEL